LPNGTRLQFEDTHDIYPYCIVPAGTLCTIRDNNLNETLESIDLLPDDKEVRAALREWDGCVVLNPANSGEGWDDQSPLSKA
jgi:hypothetical protein